MSSSSGCSWMLPCLQSFGVISAQCSGEAEPDSLSGPPSRSPSGSVWPHAGAKGCSVEPEPFPPLPPRIASTTPRGHSATNARLATSGMPQRPRLLPAGPARAHTSMPPAGRTQLGMGGCVWVSGQCNKLGAYSGQRGGRPGFKS